MKNSTIATALEALIFAYKSSIPEDKLEAAIADLTTQVEPQDGAQWMPVENGWLTLTKKKETGAVREVNTNIRLPNKNYRVYRLTPASPVSVWEPVPDGNHQNVTVGGGGTSIGIYVADYIFDDHDYGYALIELPEDWKLMRPAIAKEKENND